MSGISKIQISVLTTTKEQREQQQAINKALDETKNNIRITTDEARKDIPRYTQIVNEYQEETIQATRQMANNYLFRIYSKDLD